MRPKWLPDRDDPGLEREIAKARFQAFLKLLPYAIVSNLASVVCLFWIFHGEFEYRRGLVWLEAMAAVSAAWLIVVRRDSRGKPEPCAFAVARHAAFSFAVAGLLGLAFFALLPIFRDFELLALIVAQVIFLQAGVYINTMVPAVAIVWGTTLGVSAFAAIVAAGGEGMASSLIGYAFPFAFSALSSILFSKMYRERFAFQIRAESRERELSMIFDQSPLSIVITNKHGDIVRANKKMEELSGYDADELIGHNPRVLKSGETPPSVYKDLWERVTSGRIWSGEFVNVDKLGNKYVERATISPILDSDGTASKYMAIKEDITLQRGYELQLQRQNEIIELLLRDFEDQASDWLWELDADLRLTYISEKIQRAWGLGPLLGVPISELFGQALPPNDEEAARLLERGLAVLGGTHAFKDLEVKLLMPSGAEWFSFSAIPMYDGEGKPTGWRGSGRDITKNKALELQLERRAHFDEMTGLPNRHKFQALIEKDIGPGAAPEIALLGIMKLGKLDPIRAELGSSAYNRAIDAFVRDFQANVGSGAMLARLARDEFAFWLREPDADSVDAIHGLARSINQGLEVGDERFSLELHIGLAFFPEDSIDRNGIFRAADLALNSAIAEPGRRVVRYRAEQATAFIRRLNLVKDFHKALASGQFRVCYQAQVFADSGAIAGAEALLRWDHPQYGPVSPGEFIPLAEQSGFINALGEWALEKACRDAAGWKSGASISVNISGVQLRDARNVERATLKALRESSLPPQRLTLEITESATYGNDDIIATLTDIKRLGVSIALDDFGTGYSSLAYIQRLGIDKLKIDQAFVRGLGDGSGSDAIVETIMDLSKKLGLGTVAEGVETESQAEALRALGCEIFQGYLYGKAKSNDEFIASMKDSSNDGR